MNGMIRAFLPCGVAVLLAGCASTPSGSYPPPRLAQSPKTGWDWHFRDFVIGAWWGPGFSEAEVKVYKEAGFNVVMCGRYMAMDSYGNPIQAMKELDLAQEYNLGVMFDTYTMNDKPWGGTAGEVDGHPTHHAASLTELKWLYRRFGGHPALAGFMIGDDKSALTQRLIDCTDFLRREAPGLMPWICQNVPNPESLAEHGNPIFDTQIYPTLYSWEMSADEHARHYARAYATRREQSRRLDLLFWPMFNIASWGEGLNGFKCIPTDSLTRFPAYAALAYGAQGIMYFTYNGGALQNPGPHADEAAVRQALSPLYPVVKTQNRRIAAWGPDLIGSDSIGLFGTAWPADTGSAESLTPPAPGKLVETMDEKLMAGVLVKQGKKPMLMVVDTRTSKAFGDLAPRRVTLKLNAAVKAIDVLSVVAGIQQPRRVKGSVLTLTLAAGEGQLVVLHGRALARLATSDAIISGPVADRTASGAGEHRAQTRVNPRVSPRGANWALAAEELPAATPIMDHGVLDF